jgi:DNA polymerase-3 subunit epsilon
MRVKTALLKLKVDSWPYQGAIAIQEGADLHLFDHWCYLGTAANLVEVEELLSDGIPEFDLDIYKIIRKTLKKTKELGLRVTAIQSARHRDEATELP